MAGAAFMALHPSNPYYTNQPWNTPSRVQRSHSDAPAPPSQHPQSSTTERPRNIVTYRTRSIGGPFNAGVIFERQIDLSPPTDDEIIIATVRVTNSFRRASVEGCEELPSRPRPRGFLSRMSTRLSGPPDPNSYTAIKMPRREYKRYFAKDANCNYIGTEPEREWTREDLEREFGIYQDMPLRSIPGGQEFGEGGSRSSSVGEGSSDGVVQNHEGVYLV